MSLNVYLSVGGTADADTESVAPYPVCGSRSHQVYEANITHYLNTMAKAAGIYLHLWHPDRLNITTAAQLIGPLREGLAKLQADPAKFGAFRAFDPSSGWGDYSGLVRFVRDYLEACETYPKAKVRAWG
jgi:hypothetical protein